MTRLQFRVVLLTAVDALVLVALRPDPRTVNRDLASLGPRLSSAGADPVLAQLTGTVLWLVAAWVAIGLMAIGGSRLPGTCGRVSGRLGRLVVPRVVVTVLAGSAGVGVLIAPVVASAAPSPIWPSVPATQSSSTHVPAPVWPRSKTPAASPPTPHHAAEGAQVHPGDSLWLLAARRLGADATRTQIAGYWPEVYAANRAVIGTDPSLIIPGQRLTEPAPTAQETTP